MLLGTGPQNVVTTFRLNYCPETLLIVSGGVPQRVTIRALGEGVNFDLDATGLAALKNFRHNKDIANYYSYPIANGLLKGKNVEIDVLAHATNGITVYGYSTGALGTGYIKTERTTVLANTSVAFEKFFTLAFSAINTNDQITINYTSGVTQLFNGADEIRNLATETDVENLVIDNYDAEIESVIVVPTAQITVYKQSYSDASQTISAQRG